MKTKRRLKKIIIWCLLILAIVIGYKALIPVYTKIFTPDISELQENYIISEGKCQTLKDIRNYVVEEGVGIHVEKLPVDAVTFKIYNSNEQIIFEYYVGKKEDSNDFNARIVFTTNFEIVSEEYGRESMSYEEYEKYHLSINKTVAHFFAFLVPVVVIGIIVVIGAFIELIIDIIKIKRKANK